MFSNFAAHAKPRVALYCAHRNVICFCKVIKSKEDLNLRLSEELGCSLDNDAVDNRSDVERRVQEYCPCQNYE